MIVMIYDDYDGNFGVLPESTFHRVNKGGYGTDPKVAKRPFARTWMTIILMLILMMMMMM